MARIYPEQVEITLSEDVRKMIEGIKEKVLSEDRIRQIVREELAAWEKQLPQRMRMAAGLRMETK